MTYAELQTALKEFRTLGYELQVKLNSNKTTLQAEHDRLVADKQNLEQLSAQAESLAAVAELAEANDRAAELPETKVDFIPQPLQYLQEFFGDELPFTDDVWETQEPFTLDTIPAFEEEKYKDTIARISEHCYSAPTTTPDEPIFDLAKDLEDYQNNTEVSPPTVPASAPAIVNHASVGLTLIVLFLQALQLVTTVAIPLLIQSYAIGRKTFDAVAMAFQSEAVLRLVDAS